MSLDPAARQGGREGSSGTGLGGSGSSSSLGGSGGGGIGGGLGGRPPSGGGRTTAQLQKELEVAMARISMLESRLRAAGLEYT